MHRPPGPARAPGLQRTHPRLVNSVLLMLCCRARTQGGMVRCVVSMAAVMFPHSGVSVGWHARGLHLSVAHGLGVGVNCAQHARALSPCCRLPTRYGWRACATAVWRRTRCSSRVAWRLRRPVARCQRLRVWMPVPSADVEVVAFALLCFASAFLCFAMLLF